MPKCFPFQDIAKIVYIKFLFFILLEDIYNNIDMFITFYSIEIYIECFKAVYSSLLRLGIIFEKCH